MTKTVDGDGTIRYRNSNRNLHREDGPAYIRANGTEFWLLNGRAHREDGPAVTMADRTEAWWLNGKRHREDGPA